MERYEHLQMGPIKVTNGRWVKYTSAMRLRGKERKLRLAAEKALADLAPANKGVWYSVEKTLPPSNFLVLCYGSPDPTAEPTYYAGWLGVDFEGKPEFQAGMLYARRTTHWMYLPEAPKGLET